MLPMCQNATMRCMEYGLKHNMIYVKKNIFGNVLKSTSSWRQAATNGSICETGLFQWIEM